MEGETVLDRINLEIESESSTVILGRSGSGKSTLLKSMAGLITINDGSVLFDGQNISKMDEREFFGMQAKSGFIFQDAVLWENQTIYNNLSIPLRILNPGMEKSLIDERINSAVKMFNFQDNLQVRPSKISAGKKSFLFSGLL